MTRKRDAEMESLREREERVEQASKELASLLPSGWLKAQNRLPYPFLISDHQLRLLWINTASFQYFAEACLGGFLYAQFSNFHDESEIHHLTEALENPQNGHGWQGRVSGRRRDERLYQADLTISPLSFDQNDSPRFFAIFLNDVTDSLKSIIRANFDSILKASLLKDEDTGNHVERVNAYSRLLSSHLKGREGLDEVDDDFIEDIGILAAFHDVGKIGTPETILLKNGSLNDMEWEVMKEHTTNGAMILDAHPNPMGKEIARSHHERWDGSGYPFGLAEDDIPLSGRIVAIADVYDALRTRRPYKDPFSEERAYTIIKEGSGSHFDPHLVEVFSSIRDEFSAVFEKLGDEP